MAKPRDKTIDLMERIVGTLDPGAELVGHDVKKDSDGARIYSFRVRIPSPSEEAQAVAQAAAEQGGRSAVQQMAVPGQAAGPTGQPVPAPVQGKPAKAQFQPVQVKVAMDEKHAVLAQYSPSFLKAMGM